MRSLLLAAVILGTASVAHAADIPDFLRGSFSDGPAVHNKTWDGWYAGGQIGYSSTAEDFSNSLGGLTSYIYRDTALEASTSQLSTLGKSNAQGTGFGAFVGRNYQWEDIVLGVEANYNYFDSLGTTSASSIGPLEYSFPAGQNTPPNDTPTYTVTLSGRAAAQIKDAISFRGRAGWAAGDFLPYVFGGVAVGRMDVQRAVTSTTYRSDTVVSTTTEPDGSTLTTTTTTPFTVVPSLSTTMAQERSNDFVFGWTAGLGLEYNVWNGLFVRGEWEYIQFLSVMNTNVSLNSTRVGIGYKF